MSLSAPVQAGSPTAATTTSVWLSSTRSVAALVAHGDRRVEAAVADPHLVEHPQCAAGEVPQLGMVPFPLQFGDHDDRQHHLVLVEPPERAGIGEQHAGVEHIGPPPGDGSGPRGARGVRADGGAGLRCWHFAPHQTARALTPGPVPCRRTGTRLWEQTQGPERRSAGVHTHPVRAAGITLAPAAGDAVVGHERASRYERASPPASACESTPLKRPQTATRPNRLVNVMWPKPRCRPTANRQTGAMHPSDVVGLRRPGRLRAAVPGRGGRRRGAAARGSG